MLAVGALMISRVRTPSLKRITIAADYARYVLVGSVVLAAALADLSLGDADGAVGRLSCGDP
jgi:phosphatidylserine synthase